MNGTRETVLLHPDGEKISVRNATIYCAHCVRHSVELSLLFLSVVAYSWWAESVNNIHWRFLDNYCPRRSNVTHIYIEHASIILIRVLFDPSEIMTVKTVLSTERLMKYSSRVCSYAPP